MKSGPQKAKQRMDTSENGGVERSVIGCHVSHCSSICAQWTWLNLHIYVNIVQSCTRKWGSEWGWVEGTQAEGLSYQPFCCAFYVVDFIFLYCV